MLQGDGLNGQRAVLVDDLLTTGINRTELDLIIEVVAELCHLITQNVTQLGRSIDFQLCRTSQQSERTQHTDESETVVAMQMTDEYGTDFRKAQMRTAQLYLRPFATVDEEQLSTHFYYLRRREMFQRGQSATTT